MVILNHIQQVNGTNTLHERNRQKMILSEDRIKHMHGVAEFMYTHADKFECRHLSKEQLYVVGLLHDVGYIQGVYEHGVHGASLISKETFIYECIRWHEVPPQEYMEVNCLKESEIPQELILLWLADMSVDSTGENAGHDIGVKQRLAGIEKRFGSNSKQYKNSKKTVDWLVDNYYAVIN